MHTTAILHGVATQFAIAVSDQIGLRHSADLIPTRCAAAYVSRPCYPDLTCTMIEHLLGGRDHTTVLAECAIGGGR